MGVVWRHIFDDRVRLAALAVYLCVVVGLGQSPREQRAASPSLPPAPHIYSSDARDPWNRIFRCLFTRTFKARVSGELAAGQPTRAVGDGFSATRVSVRLFERTETGDRAIEPLYPSFLVASGPIAALREPLYSDLRGALAESLEEARARTPVERALMQSDAWAAFDILHAAPTEGYLGVKVGRAERKLLGARKAELLSLLARFIKKIALTRDEIAALPDNYRAAARAGVFPDVFASEGGWMEVEWGEHRSHDHAADFRRAARVFIRLPHATPDRHAFLNGLRNAPDPATRVEALALITQNLLIDADGRVVPSPMAYEVQFRFFEGQGASLRSEVRQFELSRGLLFKGAAPGGFAALDEKSPHYLSSAGNDYGFATPVMHVGQPVASTLRARCESCHGERTARVFTFMNHFSEQLPPVRVLTPARSERALRAARLKTERDDFRALAQLAQSLKQR